ncbi:MAG TPA: GspH/FimT family pseudopilin [Acetobacteraceae bacterium]|nr:GspH/FimT family pseudopilin [Acetobacteraceae bacterium]
MPNKIERSGGFTLLEMLVVIVVLALAVGLVVASGPSESPAASLESAASRVALGLRLARGEAIAHDHPVIVTIGARTLSIGTAPPTKLPAGASAIAGPVRVTFAPDGTAAGGPILLAAGDLRRRIAVDWMTGAVEEGRAEAPP